MTVPSALPSPTEPSELASRRDASVCFRNRTGCATSNPSGCATPPVEILGVRGQGLGARGGSFCGKPHPSRSPSLLSPLLLLWCFEERREI